MEADQSKVVGENVFNIEQGETRNNVEEGNGFASAESAHIVDQDSWRKVGLMLVTSFNCGYILSYSSLTMAPLGWIAGTICLFAVAFWTLHASWLLSSFQFIDGKRFIRYRDIMGYTYGKQMYYLTWIYQIATLVLINVGFVLLAGRALKEINSLFSDSPLRLQYYIIISGVAFFLFAFAVPTISAMGTWLVISVLLTSIYIVSLLAVMIKDGVSNESKNYDVLGSKADKVFNAFGAISSILFINTAGMLPEIQSTLRKPAVKNMRLALFAQFSAGLALYYGVTIIGYWAYGSSVSWYLPLELSGPKWVKVLINIAVFLQAIVSQNMFASPVHETLDTKFLKLGQSLHSKENIGRLFLFRALFFTGTTLIPALFPFMGDFVNLVGSFTLIPLTFVFPSLVFIKVKGKTARIEQNLWHLFNVIIFSLLCMATIVSALRLIVNNVKDYSVFADL